MPNSQLYAAIILLWTKHENISHLSWKRLVMFRFHMTNTNEHS